MPRALAGGAGGAGNPKTEGAAAKDSGRLGNIAAQFPLTLAPLPLNYT